MRVELVDRDTLQGDRIMRVEILLGEIVHVFSVSKARELAEWILELTEEIPMTEPKPTYDPGAQDQAAGRARPAERSADGPPENGDPSDASQQSAPTISLQVPPPRSGKSLWAAYIALERFYLARDKAMSWAIQGRWASEKAVAARRAEHDAWEALEPWQRERLVK